MNTGAVSPARGSVEVTRLRLTTSAAVGEQGSLITPVFIQGAWFDHLAMPECRHACPQDFRPSRWPGHEGAVAYAVLARPGRMRSCQPTHPWAANGANVGFVLKNNRTT